MQSSDEKVEMCLDKDLFGDYYLHSRDLGYVSPTFRSLKVLRCYVAGSLEKKVPESKWLDLVEGKYVYI